MYESEIIIECMMPIIKQQDGVKELEWIQKQTSAIHEQQTCYEELQVFMKKVVPEYFEKCCDPSCK
ncbi:hypothetical protein DAPPUDRAFT_257982 [Daphnia pulex]|uniref:Uncharacterized protein n=1 Tax=Daphnia pulex TaxID=6669 RepID=E9HEK7_DAPPU|nr:hypothetical protein DAPPUDRAFT_257982 [Daphnia pulex]|eukprot:EFX69770.1 hypothetical protein DAPPUDRAFT_257982 [Daphnia pulex]